jgi:hypothetical protein
MSASREQTEPQVARAEDRLDSRRVMRVAIGSVVVFVVSLGVAAALLAGFTSGRGAHPFGGGSMPSAAPSTIGTVEATLVLATARGVAAKNAQRRDLDGWGWVDRDAGIATIPVERAMDLVAADARDGGRP